MLQSSIHRRKKRPIDSSVQSNQNRRRRSSSNMEEAAAADVEMEEEHETTEHDDEKEWEAYLRSQHSHDSFAQYYRCRPMSLLGKDTAAAADYDDGNRVVMPQSALERLSSVEVEYPMVFRIQNAATLQASHCGVQEFVADEGFVHVPTHTMARLGLLHHADQLVLLASTSLPKATSVKLQPHTADFLGVKYPKELLEYNFGKYTCMTVGDTITVTEGDRRYLLDVVEAKPEDAVSTIETDCEVDFLPPLDYKEPTHVSVPSAAPVKINASQGEGRFANVGVRMDGKPVERPDPAKTATGQGEGRFSGVGVRMDGKPVERQAGPPLVGPSAKGNNVLRFGGSVSVLVAGMVRKKVNDVDAKEAKRFAGQKYSLATEIVGDFV